MDLSARVLGTPIANALYERTREAVVTIGRDKFTRADLAGVSCFNYVAARLLSNALKDLGAKSTSHVFQDIAPLSLAVPRLGAVSLAVLGACFEAKGLGGTHPLETWVTQHRDDQQRKDIVSFNSLKHRSLDMRAAADERKAAKRRRKGNGTTA